MLPSQVIDVPFTSGLDTKTDAKLSAKLARLENFVFRGGTIAKRYGSGALTTALDTGGNLAAGEGIETLDQELVRLNGGGLYTYGLAASKWVTKATGLHPNLIASKRIMRLSRFVTEHDEATVLNTTVMAWRENGSVGTGIHVTLFDNTTGAMYQSGSALLSGSTGFYPRCIAAGTKVLVFWVEGANLRVCVVDPTTPATTLTASTIRTDVSTSGSAGLLFDAVAFSGGAALVYVTGAGATGMTAIQVSSAGVVSGTTVLAAAGAAINDIDVTADSNSRIYVFFNTAGPTTNFTVLSSAFAVVLAATALSGALRLTSMTSLETSAGQVTVVGENSAPNGNPLKKAVVNAAGIVSALADIAGTTYLRLQTDLVTWDGVVCLAANNFSQAGGALDGVQCTAFVLDTSGNVLARCLMAGTISTLKKRLATSLSYVAGDMSHFLVETGRLTYDSGGTGGAVQTPTGVTRVTLTAARGNTLPRARLGGILYMGGGLPRQYDGAQVVETGFNLFPEALADLGSSGVGGLSLGSYQWKALFSWVDAQGQLCRSAPSIAVTAASGAGQNRDIQIPTLPLTGKSNVQIELYRTTANGTVFYRATSVAAAYSTGATNITITDAVADTALVSGELLFTTGGVLDAIAPPPYRYSVAFRDRLIIAGLEDPYEIRFSTQRVKNEQVRFNESLTMRVPAETGKVTGLAVLDDKLAIFTESLIYVVFGDGPDARGLGTSFSQPAAVATDTGCNESGSIVSYPGGILFKGSQGICQLGRGLEVTYIGAEVEAYAAYTIRSAICVGAYDQVRFQCDTGSDLSTGTAIVFDYQYNQWFVFTSYGAQDATLYGGKYTRVRSDGAIYQEDSTLYTDAGVSYAGVLETQWVKVAGLQGFQRIRRALLLGQLASNCTFMWETAYDYGSTYDAQDTATIATSGVWTVGAPFQARRHMRVQKCEALRFRISETALSSAFGGLALTGLAFEVAAKQGHFRGLASGKSF